ncbi:hypothetical protein with integrase and ribonuclease H-like domains [Klebsormidium nitens]|uniref:Uncharacterized protein n=1 Tax=Klebsormidium nitens TaxID=105231 RepID=A0A1Y1IP85_KLENI|nr:hypothetical protein with integrase and ribonuclease H-like domains [Klebsormidium nitens]|eukprot:GAQ89928.1 hypothetical protein with integrase and ribonuclease H-like domains [Klebsormidium nitens]
MIIVSVTRYVSVFHQNPPRVILASPRSSPCPSKGLASTSRGRCRACGRATSTWWCWWRGFSKTVALVPTRDKEPSTVVGTVDVLVLTQEAFTQEVLTRFGAPTEVVTDRGGEFAAEFQACLDAALHTDVAGGILAVPAHVRAGTTVPGAIKVEVAKSLDMDNEEQTLDLDNEERLVALVAQRAKLFERWVPMAMGNLEIAHHWHRDTLRYAQTRNGAWKPEAAGG